MGENVKISGFFFFVRDFVWLYIWHILHWITNVQSFPHHYFIIITFLPLFPHHHILTIISSSLFPQHYFIIITFSPLHSHHHMLTIISSPSLPHLIASIAGKDAHVHLVKRRPTIEAVESEGVCRCPYAYARYHQEGCRHAQDTHCGWTIKIVVDGFVHWDRNWWGWSKYMVIVTRELVTGITLRCLRHCQFKI